MRLYTTHRALAHRLFGLVGRASPIAHTRQAKGVCAARKQPEALLLLQDVVVANVALQILRQTQLFVHGVHVLLGVEALGQSVCVKARVAISAQTLQEERARFAARGERRKPTDTPE